MLITNDTTGSLTVLLVRRTCFPDYQPQLTGLSGRVDMSDIYQQKSPRATSQYWPQNNYRAAMRCPRCAVLRLATRLMLGRTFNLDIPALRARRSFRLVGSWSIARPRLCRSISNALAIPYAGGHVIHRVIMASCVLTSHTIGHMPVKMSAKDDLQRNPRTLLGRFFTNWDQVPL